MFTLIDKFDTYIDSKGQATRWIADLFGSLGIGTVIALILFW